MENTFILFTAEMGRNERLIARGISWLIGIVGKFYRHIKVLRCNLHVENNKTRYIARLPL